MHKIASGTLHGQQIGPVTTTTLNGGEAVRRREWIGPDGWLRLVMGQVPARGRGYR